MKCKSCGATDARGNTHIFRNLGGKRRYHESNTRRYECSNCGHRFLSVETYHRDILPTESEESCAKRLPDPQPNGN